MAWTTPKVWAVGDLLTAALMNQYVSDDLTALYGYSGNKPVFILENSGGQSIASAAWTVITMDTETEDTHNGHAAGASRYTIPVAGIWLFCYTSGFNSNGTGTRGVSLFVNGIQQGQGRTLVQSQTAGGGDTTATQHRRLAVNDYVEVAGYQSSGAALLTAAGHSNISGSWQRL